MTIEPGDRCGNKCKDNSMGNKLPDLVLIETLVSGTMQLREGLVQTIGDRLTLTLIDVSGKTDAQDGNNRRGGGNLCIEMDGVVLTAGRHKATERTFPSEETTKGSIDTHTDSNQAEHNQRDCHRGRSLMGSMMRMGLHILRTPEDTVVQTEHIEGRHRSNTCHDPTYYRTIGKASRDNLILRTET